MKPVPFSYSRPDTIEDACVLLAGDEDAVVLAGGQTLIPMLAMRLARPSQLVDIARISALTGINALDDGGLWIGAATRQVEIERSVEVLRCAPLLAKAMPWVGHAPTRARGTIGGSMANADPAAEIPLAALASGAVVEVKTGTGTMELTIEGYFLGPMVTAVPEAALVTGIRFQAPPPGRLGTAFHEVAARRGDFAFASAAARIVLDDNGHCIDLRLAIGGACDVPVLLSDVGAALIGQQLRRTDFDDAVGAAVAELDCIGDLHASADYRRRAASTLAKRALTEALNEALGAPT
ncbi:MAG: xanthine dehydrogenase family protein subunit M [Rhodospirillaceae bacterium]|nr:xanthine dehydrogenase family protein subunit M [Rhodospirillaceae bacterium]MBT6137603.1 xanthine dehydrogenase family protein subunit M [Rhodospirillaceae bacterium]